MKCKQRKISYLVFSLFAQKLIIWVDLAFLFFSFNSIPCIYIDKSVILIHSNGLCLNINQNVSKPRGDVTRSPKHGFQWPQKEDLCPPIFLKKEKVQLCLPFT